MLVEVQIGVQYLDQKVEILGLCHANLRCLQSLAQLSHHLVTLLATGAEVQVRCQSNRLRLQILLEQLVGVAGGVGAECLEVICAEAVQRVQGRDNQIEGGHFGITFGDFFLKDYVSLGHELVCLILELGHRAEVIDGLGGLQVETESLLWVLWL